LFLLGRHFTTWAMYSALFFFFISMNEFGNFYLSSVAKVFFFWKSFRNWILGIIFFNSRKSFCF
jgi:hypothetical protein